MKNLSLFLILLLSASLSQGQHNQLCDSTFQYSIENPTYTGDDGPVVWIDEAHHNFHTKDGRYCGFAKVLEADGYGVASNDQPFDKADLSQCDILVIANALDEETALRGWRLPNRSAFSSAEINALQRWVSRGGSLMLIADHMPFPGCAGELAAAFGFSFTNGYASSMNPMDATAIFSSQKENLHPHPITKDIPQVASFTGQAFRSPPGAEPLMTFGDDHQMILNSRVGQLDPKTNPTFSLKGWHQGAVLAFGQGRVAVFGEAAMFTAQSYSQGNGQTLHFGLLHPSASHNAQFLRNTMQWLNGDLGWQVSPETAKAICAQNFGMEEGMRSGNMQTVADYYLDDAIVTSPGGLSAKGRKQVDAYWGKFGGLDWRLDVVALAPTLEALQQTSAYQLLEGPFPDWTAHLPDRELGQLVYQLGRSHLTYHGFGQKRLSIVNFLIVWEKQSDNTFKILVDTYR